MNVAIIERRVRHADSERGRDSRNRLSSAAVRLLSLTLARADRDMGDRGESRHWAWDAEEPKDPT